MQATLMHSAGPTWAVVVGESTNPHGPWTYERGSAARIYKLCGRQLSWYNLFEPEPECWDAREASDRAVDLMLNLPAGTGLLELLGRRVQAAFGLGKDAEPLSLHRSGSYLLRAVPHPSGLNRWWNTPRNVRRAEETLSTDATELTRYIEEGAVP